MPGDCRRTIQPSSGDDASPEGVSDEPRRNALSNIPGERQRRIRHRENAWEKVAEHLRS